MHITYLQSEQRSSRRQTEKMIFSESTPRKPSLRLSSLTPTLHDRVSTTPDVATVARQGREDIGRRGGRLPLPNHCATRRRSRTKWPDPTCLQYICILLIRRLGLPRHAELFRRSSSAVVTPVFILGRAGPLYVIKMMSAHIHVDSVPQQNESFS